MKKTIFGLLALSALSTASAANYVGGSIGTGGSLHYQQDRSASTAMRYSLDLRTTGFNFGMLNLGGSVDYLVNMPNQTPSALTPYYGAGLGAFVGLNSSAAGVALYPHVLLGAKYNLSAPLSIFGEVNAGPLVGFATSGGQSAMGFDLGWGARLGLNYRLSN